MKQRKKQPKNNKYYIRKVSGGLNGAVQGYPTIKGANVLCNCVGYANGRFNEIINDPDLEYKPKKFKYQLVCNAENFIESAKKQGLKISSKPTKGGIMVWQKGRTLNGSDGAGHVAIVEQINKDGSIITSESGYGAWAFKRIKRTNSNGRWGQSSAYHFRGCIVNPSIKKTPKKVKVTPAKTQSKKPTVPSLTLKKTNADVIKDTIEWGRWIAKNNDFHYGFGTAAHHNGCYFCDTNKKFKKGHGIKGWNFTSCCNPFVNSAWAHGGGVKEMLDLCRSCHSYGFAKGEGYDTSPLFKKMGLLPNYKTKNLKAGDVICTPSHVMLYIGDGKVCHAGYEDDNVIGSKKWNKSICVEDLKDSWHYKHQYNSMRVYRYTGSVNVKMPIRFGEHSYRVKQLQECLKYLKYKIEVDGYYGEETLKVVQKFKAKHGMNSTGAVAEKTIAALRKAVK